MGRFMKKVICFTVRVGHNATAYRDLLWWDEAPHIEFVYGEVRFYKEGCCSVNSHYRMYKPQRGEHLEIFEV